MIISVIIPIYKAEKYLKKCIDSLLSQRFNNVEIILVDDGSPDNCPQICDEYAEKDDRIKVIHKKNEGVSIARSIGVSEASGNYFTFVDSDDWVESNYFESIFKIIKETNADIICFGHKTRINDKTIPNPFPLQKGKYNREKIEKQIFPYLIEDSFCNYFPNQLWNKVIKADLYRNNQVDGVKIVMGEDAACVKACVFNCSNLIVSQSLLYNYRINPDSVTVSGSPLLWDGPFLIQEHYRKHLDLSTSDLQQQVYRNTVHNLFNVALSQFSRDEKYKKISKEIKRKLSSSKYAIAVSEAHFSNLKGKICELAVRYKMCIVFYLRWKCKYKSKGSVTSVRESIL